MRIRETWRMRATGVALAVLLAGAGAAPAPADPLTVEKDGVVKVEKALEVGGKVQADTVKVEKQLEVGPNGLGINDKGATIQGIDGRNYFQDSEKAGVLRVGGVWGIPGIYSEKGDVAVGSQSGKIKLKGTAEANAINAEKTLEVGPNGKDIDDKGATVQGFNGRNYFQDSEKAGALRVGALGGTPGIYSEKGDIAVGSQSGKIALKGAVEAESFHGKGALPVGAILMWSGSLPDMPDGWALCDGGNGTPNLAEGFIGVSRAYYYLATIMYKGSSDKEFRIPYGSYGQTCNNSKQSADILEADCLKADQRTRVTAKLDLKTCPMKGDIWNLNGQLFCK